GPVVGTLGPLAETFGQPRTFDFKEPLKFIVALPVGDDHHALIMITRWSLTTIGMRSFSLFFPTSDCSGAPMFPSFALDDMIVHAHLTYAVPLHLLYVPDPSASPSALYVGSAEGQDFRCGTVGATLPDLLPSLLIDLNQ